MNNPNYVTLFRATEKPGYNIYGQTGYNYNQTLVIALVAVAEIVVSA